MTRKYMYEWDILREDEDIGGREWQTLRLSSDRILSEQEARQAFADTFLQTDDDGNLIQDKYGLFDFASLSNFRVLQRDISLF